ncbi:MAG: hypothetical protein GKR92_02655 [Gammaproteobacteria bacterium]|nr:MAG: hypothetical protein GKR92_02655 [Gammaproteobacteria bacterium]
MRRNFTHIWVAMITMCCALAVLSSCKTGSSDSADGFGTINYPMVYVQRNLAAVGDPTDGVTFAAGGDLMYKDASTGAITSINITSGYTQGQGDVSDPATNYDATKVVFSMRGPNDETFSLWEMDVASRQYYRLIADPVVEQFGDDVDPAYLPDGRIVFSSNRQKRMLEMQTEQNIQQHKTLDEYEREEALNLHVLNLDTQDITQISFNQSHDRNPSVLKDGRIMFSRWDHLANRNHFPIFTVNPDGTDMFVLYGAFSPGNSFLHPMEQQNGNILTTLMPLSGTDEGGALFTINANNYSDDCEPAPGIAAGCNGQNKPDGQVNFAEVTFDGSFSPGGRYASPDPLWDGTGRVLVSRAPAPNPLLGIPTEPHPFNGEDIDVFGPSNYRMFMVDFNNDARPIETIVANGMAHLDPVALFPRALSDVPLIRPDKPVNPALAVEPNGLGGQGMGVLGIRSVYHTDFLDIMGDRVLVPALGESIPKIGGSPDLFTMKDPNNASYLNRPGYFARVTRALPTPPGISRSAIGRTNFEMQEVVGYVPVEPDGSILAKVPADSALTISVLDQTGRAFQTHTNWLQVRPGETRTCNGCHSPRRAESSINIAPIAGNHANSLGAETMAETRARLNNEAAPSLNADAVFTEFWSANLEQDFTLSLASLTTPVPDNGRIDYVTHIQPLFEKDRGADTCTSCHNNNLLLNPISGGLTLEGGLSGFAGHIISYDQLMRGPFKVDENGIPLPPFLNSNGRVVFPRGPALVRVGSSANSSRTSHLVETLYNTKLRAGGSYDLGLTDHSSMMLADEKWLISTWVDVGAQYTNEPYELVGGQYVVRDAIVSSRTVSRSVFNDTIHPILKNECMSCHAPEGFDAESSEDPQQFADENNEEHEFNRFILTGNQSGDFNVTRAMINDLCNPMDNILLLRPTSDNVAPNLPHPQILSDINDVNSATRPVFLNTGPGSSYDAILTWLMIGEASNPTCLN